MALIKKIILPNGLEPSYHTISSISVNTDKIEIELHSFISKEYYDRAIAKEQRIKEQNDLILEFDELNNKERTKLEDKKLDKISSKINELADEIDSLKNYEDFVVSISKLEIPYMENFSTNNLEKELLNIEEFKLAKISK